DYPLDRYLEQALKNTVLSLKEHWEPALARDELSFGRDPKRISFLLKNTSFEADPKILSHLLRAGQVAPNDLDKTISSIVNNATSADLEKLMAHDFPKEIRFKLLQGLTRPAKERKIAPSAELQKTVQTFIDADDVELRSAAVRLAGAWKQEQLRDRFQEIVSDKTNSLQLRKAAVDGIAFLGGGASSHFLEQQMQSELDLDLLQHQLTSLAELDITAAARSTSELLTESREEAAIAALFQPFLQRNGGTDILADSLRVNPIHRDNAKLGLRLLQKLGRQDPGLNSVVAQSAGVHDDSPEMSRQQLQELARAVLEKGDPSRGERVFRRQELSCYQCHAISGAGNSLGPDLSAIGSGSTLDYLIESLLYPNKVIKDGFETVEVITRDEEYVIGIKVRENAREIVLKDVMRDEIVLPTSDIKEKRNKPISLMPAGLTSGLTENEFLDLCRFLAELGKPGPYANDPRFLVRRWQYAFPLGPDREALDWNPVYATVSGELPLEDIERERSASKVLLRTQLEVTTPGQIQLKASSTEGIKLLSSDGNFLGLESVASLEFPRGIHHVVFEVDLKKRTSPIAVEFQRPESGAAGFQLITGR
ncbi:MAG: hypothetical protein ACK4UN_10220, partial [Limisphaerales bacterium]